MPEIGFSRYRFRPRFFTTALAIGFVAMTFLLGQWQTGRAEEKLRMQALLEKLLADPPLALPTAIVAGEDWVQRRVVVRGQFEGPTFFVDNKVYRGAAGYHVITPLCVEKGRACVLVNRGWIAAGPRRDVLPAIDRSSAPAELEGIAVIPPSHRYELSEPSGDGPVVQNLVVDRLSARTSLPLQPFVLLQTSATKDTLTRDWPRPDAGVDTHRAYALQWYVMALVGIVLWVKLNLHRASKKEENDIA